MNRDQAREYIRAQLEDYLQGKGINTSRPFNCLNPEHPDRNPSMSFDRRRNKCKCFSCGVDYDTLDLIGLDYGLSGNDLFLKAYQLYNITIDTQAPGNDFTNLDNPAPAPTQTAGDLLAYYQICQERLVKTDYLTARGISTETAARFMLGYDPDFREGTGGRSWAALIIPTSRESYTARNTDPEAGAKDRYRKKGGSNIFNLKALAGSTAPLFITEGELDALSIIEAGGEAIALGSTENTGKLLSALETTRPARPVILALDNDTRGRAASQTLADGLQRLSISFISPDIYGGYKDANERLIADRAGLEEEIQQVYGKVLEIEKKEAEREIEEYSQNSAANYIESFIQEIESSKTASYIPTGFKNVDEILDGGLYAGLYVVGAISSLGKTTFCLQVADQVAAAGHDVIIFSLEMARSELMAKSISRNSYIVSQRQTKDSAAAKTTRGIMTGSRYANYSELDRAIIRGAFKEYSQYAGHIYIKEGVGDIGVKQVREAVEQHINITGRSPVILIDYLQILAPYNDRATDKQNTDKAVLELKRISRDYSLPVLAISSFNRDNYTSPVNMASFKESGAVEYSSDVLLALQYAGMDYAEGEAEKNREKRVRQLIKEAVANGKSGKPQLIQLKILKNRNGSKGETLLDFFPMFNYFQDSNLTPIGDGLPFYNEPIQRR